MEKIQILSIGRDPVLLQKLSAFINENPNWESNATVDDETSVEIFHQRKFDIVLVIDSIGEESEKKLRSIFSFHDPGITFIHHTGDSTGLLAAEIQEALNNRNYGRNKIIDDVFDE